MTRRIEPAKRKFANVTVEDVGPKSIPINITYVEREPEPPRFIHITHVESLADYESTREVEVQTSAERLMAMQWTALERRYGDDEAFWDLIDRSRVQRGGQS